MPLLHDDTFRRLCRARDLAGSSFREPVRLDLLAREACLSPFHFHRLFTSTFGETPHEFITRLRLDHAKCMLAANNLSVTEICFESGYTSLGSFSSKFQATIGSSPSEYRRNLHRVFGFPALSVFVPQCFGGLYS